MTGLHSKVTADRDAKPPAHTCHALAVDGRNELAAGNNNNTFAGRTVGRHDRTSTGRAAEQHNAENSEGIVSFRKSRSALRDAYLRLAKHPVARDGISGDNGVLPVVEKFEVVKLGNRCPWLGTPAESTSC